VKGPPQRARGQFAIGRVRILQRTFGLHLHGGVKYRVDRGDLLQMSGDQLARGDTAYPDQAGLLPGGERQNVVFRGAL
jgi:hypothetical protein